MTSKVATSSSHCCHFEVLRLREGDFFLEGSDEHDDPHIRFAPRVCDGELPGLGKIRHVAHAQLAPEAVKTLQKVIDHGLERALLPPLSDFKKKRADVFRMHMKPLRADTFKAPIAKSDGLWFPSPRPGKMPWLTRQAVWKGLRKACNVMFALTTSRRYNPR